MRRSADERSTLFEGAARPAALVLLAAEHGEEGADAFGILHGLYWVVVGLATETPLVLFVDDVQWADRPSLRFLVHLARRLEGTSAALVVGLRTGELEAPDELLEDLCSADGARIVRPAPLSEGAVVAVVRGELAADADDQFCRACHQATGGNPFYLRELLRALAAESVAPAREEVIVLARIGARRRCASAPPFDASALQKNEPTCMMSIWALTRIWTTASTLPRLLHHTLTSPSSAS